ncbi:signal peptide-containing protein [Theileria equi strain WA]|uniref:Signal peptide-containing protein n=1 Tax=Theileria equi strain WA TaxID=1537102 RepID=L0AX46_THEEQ|nr:signal peptide-containing protein [Theileria equi strain WA]AFZ79454.1 signal peptide-containing protein [Theileria equi strain WA]|eukprot:XP_004829120.1 signal peptide-containing protein [Theileria equi strain WA]
MKLLSVFSLLFFFGLSSCADDVVLDGFSDPAPEEPTPVEAPESEGDDFVPEVEPYMRELLN